MHDPKSEQELVVAAQSDPTQFGPLYTRYIDEIYRFVFYRIGRKADAEEVTSTVFLSVLESIGKYKKKEGAKFSSWLYQIARYKIADYYRSKKETYDIDELINQLPDNENIENELEAKEDKKEIVICLKELKTEDRELLILRIWQKKKHRQIAEILNISENTCKKRYERVLKKFHQIYNDLTTEK